jgi:hypothetical protein
MSLSTPDFDTTADVYRRCIVVRELEPGVVECDLEDDFHHFVVTLRHTTERVVGVEMSARRWPWATCPAAGGALQSLLAMPLSPRFTDVGRWSDPKLACTHQFDAAAHAITHAAGRVTGKRPLALRRHDCEIGAHMRSAPDAGRNRLWVDGELALQWQVEARVGIVDVTPPFDAAPWKGGFMRWADANLDPEAAEQAIVLRRASDIGMGRGMPLDDVPVASDLSPVMGGVCYTMQPEHAPHGTRNVGNIVDFAATPDRLGLPHQTL